MDVKLVVVGGEAQAAEYSLTLPSIVGRSRTADVKLGHPLVSRKHCELYESEGQLAVRDLGSLNGTFVGETRISEPVYLPPGSTVTIGAVTFKALYGDMEDQTADADTGELPDFSAPRATAVEQTLEMSGEAPITEPVENAADADAGFDFGWLDDQPAEGEAEDQSAAEPEAAIGDSEPEPEPEPVAEESEPEPELELPDPEVHAQNGEAEVGNEFAPPEEQPAASGNDDEDLSDFFASLK